MTALPSPPRDLAERAVANTIETFRVLARVAPRGAIEESGGLTLIATGIPTSEFNPAYVTRPQGDPIAAAVRLRAFYARAGVSSELNATGEAAGEFAAQVAAAAGMVPDGPVAGMLLAPLPDEPAAPADLEIRVVSDPATMLRHTATLARGFGSPHEMLAIYDDPGVLAVPDLTCYLGFVAGEPVATAMRFTSHRIAGIYNITTVPEYRRRGYGWALTTRAAFDGRAEGCLASALQSSPMGRPLYERIGYRQAITYRTWTWR